LNAEQRLRLLFVDHDDLDRFDPNHETWTILYNPERDLRENRLPLFRAALWIAVSRLA